MSITRDIALGSLLASLARLASSAPYDATSNDVTAVAVFLA